MITDHRRNFDLQSSAITCTDQRLHVAAPTGNEYDNAQHENP
jgi:hypothetical protein